MTRPGRIILRVIAALGVLGIVAAALTPQPIDAAEPSQFVGVLGLFLGLILGAIYALDLGARAVLRARRHFAKPSY